MLAAATKVDGSSVSLRLMALSPLVTRRAVTSASSVRQPWHRDARVGSDSSDSSVFDDDDDDIDDADGDYDDETLKFTRRRRRRSYDFISGRQHVLLDSPECSRQPGACESLDQSQQFIDTTRDLTTSSTELDYDLTDSDISSLDTDTTDSEFDTLPQNTACTANESRHARDHAQGRSLTSGRDVTEQSKNALKFNSWITCLPSSRTRDVAKRQSSCKNDKNKTQSLNLEDEKLEDDKYHVVSSSENKNVVHNFKHLTYSDVLNYINNLPVYNNNNHKHVLLRPDAAAASVERAVQSTSLSSSSARAGSDVGVCCLVQGEENTLRHEENGEVVMITEHRVLDGGNRKGHIVIKVRLITPLYSGIACLRIAAAVVTR